MNKEEWTDYIMESASEVKEVEPDPYLFQNVVSSIDRSEKSATANLQFRLGWAAVFALVITVNASALAIYKVKTIMQSKTEAIDALSDEINSNTTYNY